MFPDYLIGDLDDKKRRAVQSHIADCGSCRDELESLSSVWAKLGVLPEEKPSQDLRSRFYTMLAAYKQGLNVERVRPSFRHVLTEWIMRRWPRRPASQFAAALALLVFGMAAGYWLKPANGVSADVAPLRQEMRDMQATLAMSLLDNDSAGERLRGVSLSSRMDQPGDRLLESLLQTLDTDPNPNVRLAVVDALYLFRDHPAVRRSLSESLSKQTSPLVQVALIDLIVSIREHRAVEALKSLIGSGSLNPEVEERARRGLEKLL
jgi:hypothetical protein